MDDNGQSSALIEGGRLEVVQDAQVWDGWNNLGRDWPGELEVGRGCPLRGLAVATRSLDHSYNEVMHLSKCGSMPKLPMRNFIFAIQMHNHNFGGI